MSTQDMEAALRSGFPISCASCEHFHNAQKTDAPDCGRLLSCGGPIFGRTFPDYKGPLTPEAFASLCLICGSQDISFHALAGLRRFGLCFKHRSVFNKAFGPGTQVPPIMKVPGRLS